MTAVDRGRVIVTGASTGIGEATALHQRQLGFSVLAGVRREEDAERLREHGLTPLQLDVTVPVLGGLRTQGAFHRRAVPGCWS